MKRSIGTTINVPIIVFVILFVAIGIFSISFLKLIYAQTTDNNKTLDDAVETLGKQLEEIFSDKSKSVSNFSQSIYNIENADLKEHKNKMLGIQFKYPSPDWTLDFNNNIITLFPDNFFDKNKYSISITKTDLGKLSNINNTTESLVTEYVNQYVNSERYVVPGISDNPNKNDKLLNVNLSKTSIKGYQFFLMDKFDPLSNTITATTINNTLYTIEYKYPSSLFDPTPRQKYLPIYEQILNSIQFTSDNPKQNGQDGLLITTPNQTQLSNNSIQNSNISKTIELEILSHTSFIDSVGNMHVVGEVENNTPNVAQFVQIIATFYENNNKVVGTSNTYTTPTDLKPGEKAPFDLILGGASVPVEQIERYTLKVSGQ